MNHGDVEIIAMSDWISFLQLVDFSLPSDTGELLILFAQTFEDNLGSSVGNAWDNFIESGQVWALGIGFILGYIVRSLTAY